MCEECAILRARNVRRREKESTGELSRREDVGADVMAKGVGVGVGVVVREREPHQRPHHLHLDVTVCTPKQWHCGQHH